ncbi:hypothetical protein O3G_MSEX005674 [Manduca sexta]|uniref:Uncharacterized protein n=1 Tax=Manduca sexta TaxID=7130 RepID=A0A921Z0I9_MANSE|nr:hypothetical protein O3G_MSEX005674 [Manduca sexta]
MLKEDFVKKFNDPPTFDKTSDNYDRIKAIGNGAYGEVLKKKTWTLCGTPEYIAPEVIMSKGYSFGVDWWALGVLIFEMQAGHPPFFASDPSKLYEKVLEGQYKFPETFNAECKNLIKGLLQVDPSKRIGALKSGVYDIKCHSWFNSIDWQAILHQKCEPPFTPICHSPGDTSNFPEISQPKLKKSSVCFYEKEFEDF